MCAVCIAEGALHGYACYNLLVGGEGTMNVEVPP